ncbi:hypothetical protein [Sinomonas atrocyanea]
MSTHHSDGVGEAVDDMLRQAVMVAARIGEIAARARQEHLAQARAASERAGRELAARFEAERGAARASLAGARSDSWWAQADPERIGAAYKTAVSWAGQDMEIAQTLRHMDEQLAERGVHVTASMPERVTDLLHSRQWVAEHDPFMDEAWTREMSQARSPEERDRLNVALVSAWLARPEAQQADAAANELEAAKAWAASADPERFAQWTRSHAAADTVAAARSDEAELVRRWKAETGQPAEAQAASVESDRLTGDAVRETGAAAGHRVDGDQAIGWSQEWEGWRTWPVPPRRTWRGPLGRSSSGRNPWRTMSGTQRSGAGSSPPPSKAWPTRPPWTPACWPTSARAPIPARPSPRPRATPLRRSRTAALPARPS